MYRARSSFLALAIAASLLLGAGMTATPAVAAPLFYNFAGTITESEAPLSSQIAIGGTVTGSFGLATNTPDIPGNHDALYVGAVNNLVMHFQQTAGYAVFDGPGVNQLRIINDSPLAPPGVPGIGDRWQLQSPAQGGGIGGFFPHE